MAARTLPKSLHTVTTLANVADALRKQAFLLTGQTMGRTPEEWIYCAQVACGLEALDDEHGILSAASARFRKLPQPVTTLRGMV